MGVYTGAGKIVEGGETTRTLKSFYEWGAFAIRQKCVSSTLRKPGVSLAAAQAEHGSDNLTAVSGGSGSLAWIIYDAEGVRKTVSYSQIDGSNLYELNITTENYTAWRSSSTARSLN